MKLKKVISVLAAGIVAALALVGCGGKNGSVDGSDDLPSDDDTSVVTPVDPTPDPDPDDPDDNTPSEEVKKPIDRTDIYINDADDKPITPSAPFDDSRKYDYSSVVYENKWGSFTKSDNTYIAGIPIGDIALCSAVPFPYGTVSCTVRSTNLVDTGFIFCASEPPTGAYNDAAMSYYFYFLGMGGSAYLGKWEGPQNRWTALTVKSVGAVDPNKDYKLKVVLKGNYIVCYMNDEIMFGYKDGNFLTGTGFGLRVTAHPDVNSASTAMGVKISDMVVTNDYIY